MQAVFLLFFLEGPNAVDPLIKVFQKELDQSNHRIIAILLGHLGGKKAVDTLTYALQNDPDYGVRIYAIEALGKIGDPRAISALEQEMQKNNYPYIQGECQEAIAKLKSAVARPGGLSPATSAAE